MKQNEKKPPLPKAKPKQTVAQATSEVVRDLTELFDETNADGSPKFSELDYFVTRSILLLEMLKAEGGIEHFSEDRALELALLLDSMGIHGKTPPQAIDGIIVNYFKGMKDNIHPELMPRLLGIRKKASFQRANKVAAVAGAFRALEGKEAVLAPSHDEKPPEDSQRAQSLSLKLGWKVRI